VIRLILAVIIGNYLTAYVAVYGRKIGASLSRKRKG
jgi:hypothetical protein